MKSVGETEEQGGAFCLFLFLIDFRGSFFEGDAAGVGEGLEGLSSEQDGKFLENQ